MENMLIPAALGAFLVLMGIYIILHPKFGFKVNHFLERNPREPTEKDIRMMKVSGAVTILVGVVVLAGTLGILK